MHLVMCCCEHMNLLLQMLQEGADGCNIFCSQPSLLRSSKWLGAVGNIDWAPVGCRKGPRAPPNLQVCPVACVTLHLESMHFCSCLLILFKLFLRILLLDPTFSFIILFYQFVHAFESLKIPVHFSGSRDTLKKVICLSLLHALLLLLCHVHC